ncbi:MBL fold metallo-hydrolase [Candidatus Thiodictyon syntrophicum]|jgi:glyoxylase-like metal-dependent hydrolase (beta-lactamase superfamily II)|uniref:MBL fold metallo-hydrolase n=1 Tax=Candidatus Thiodictyon syntrophicum TaxID=1166950 RepID=A0A2K8UG80_9GAMM|nr:MBL fold metallo-hydrolase [Candidatus Thiodictyon syntrophicum]AUB84131.1 MBL fold metallo-hydrolase [Candidatus Thiodictyon syntrophicum]
MSSPAILEVADQVFRIETGLYRHGLAACYLVRSHDRLALVETGTAHTVPRLLQFIGELGLTPAHVDYVMPTHVHLDHAGGSGDLIAACPGAQLVIHPKGAPHMLDPARLIAGASAVYGADGFARDYGHLLPVPKARMIIAADGQEFDLAGRTLTFIDTPGHANHHGCIYDERTRGFFTGDTFGISYREFDQAAAPWLFAPTTPVAFDPESWLTTLDKLMAFKPTAMYLTHYGRVDAPETLVDGLRESIRALAAIALAEEDRDDPGRAARLKDAVSRHLVASARAHGVDMDHGRIIELLALDTELNAQGLEVWLRRLEKSAAGRVLK